MRWETKISYAASGGARNLQLGMPSKYNRLANVITARERWPMRARTRGAGAARRSLEWVSGVAVEQQPQSRGCTIAAYAMRHRRDERGKG